MQELMNRRGVSTTLALLAALALAACDNSEAKDASNVTPAPTTIGTENIVVLKQADLASGPAISGNLQAAQEATVRAQISGTVLQTLVDEGSRVANGTLLARIDDRTIRDQYLSARSAVTSAQSTADVAKRNLERNERLATAGAIADRDLEAARSQNEAAQSQLADARARLTLQEKQLADAQIRAPFTGIVARRQVSGGDVVQPGGEMFTIVDPSTMRLEAAVPANQLAAIKIGSPVSFSVSGYPDRAFTGKVERVDVELGLRDEETERVEVKSGLTPGDTLLVGAARGISPGTPVRVSTPSDTPASKS